MERNFWYGTFHPHSYVENTQSKGFRIFGFIVQGQQAIRIRIPIFSKNSSFSVQTPLNPDGQADGGRLQRNRWT